MTRRCPIYSRTVIDFQLAAVEQAESERRGKPFKIVRFPAEVITEMVEHLDSLLGDDGVFTRDLDSTEQSFIDNELILSKLDFQHYCENYCNPPEAPIWMADGSFKPLGSIVPGDVVVGWEKREVVQRTRSPWTTRDAFCESKVIAVQRRRAPIVKVVMESGAVIRCTPDHLWANGITNAVNKWVTVVQNVGIGLGRFGRPRNRTTLRRFVTPVPTIPAGLRRDAAWLAGMYDGEGSGVNIAQSKAHNPIVYAELKAALSKLGFDFCELKRGMGFNFRGGRDAIVKFLNWVAPFKREFLLKRSFGFATATADSVISVVDDGIGEVVSMMTTTGNYVAWGYGSKNCYIRLSTQSDRPEGWDLLDAAQRTKKGGKAGSGPIGKFILNGMQLALLQKLGELEEVAWSQYLRGQPVNGILLILLKARQLGASTFWQIALGHRTTFYSYYPVLMAGIDDQDTQRLYHDKAQLAYSHLPVWMKRQCELPKDKRRSQVDRGDEFSNGSLIELQDFSQDKDLGKGYTWKGFHGTEISSVAANRYDDHFEEGLFHAIPYDIDVLFGMESTAKGKTGPWYDFVMQVLSGSAEGGAGRFTAFFAPCYLIDVVDSARGQRSKYRMEPPSNWQPRPETLLMAEKVRETSHLYTPDHRTVVLPRDFMYWYERTRWMFYRRGKLNLFLQAYPLTPDEAFQHGSAGAFTTETINRLDLHCARFDPLPYRLGTLDEAEELESTLPPDTPHPALKMGAHALIPMHADELDNDPRGIIWIWELPDYKADYYLGSDPTGGIPRWSRMARTHNDINTDNGTVSIWRKGRTVQPCSDCIGRGWNKSDQHAELQIECQTCDGRGKVGGRVAQCAEFAAPIDPEELALYVYILGRLYKGATDFDECLAIVENNNTGILTIRTLQNKYHYSNLWTSESVARADENIKLLSTVGWNSSGSSVPILHARARIVVVKRDVEIRSKWLVKELSDAVVKTVGVDSDRSKSVIAHERFMVPPGGGRHDDRWSAAFMAWWVALHWADGDDYETPEETANKDVPAIYNPAARDVTSGQQRAIWNDAVEALMGQYDLHFGHYPDCSVQCNADHSVDDAEATQYEEEMDLYNDDPDDELLNIS